LKFNRTPIVIIICTALLFGFFQNCTPAVPFGNTDYYSALVNSSVFPYEIGIDQLAYLSCSEQEDVFNDGTFFTFRGGAYESLGLRINQEYRESIKKVSDENVITALKESPASAGTQIQMAVRTLDNLQLMYVDQDNGSEGTNGSDYNNFFPTLGDTNFSSLLWYMESGDYLRYWAGAQFISDYRFEGEIQFMKSQLMENDLRSFLSNRGVITYSFADPGKIKPLGPGTFLDLARFEGTGTVPPVGNSKVQTQKYSTDLAKNIFGFAIQPKFKQSLFHKRTPGTTGANIANFTDVNPGSEMPPRVLSSVNEIKVDERTSLAALRPWTCPTTMNFMIVLPKDAKATTFIRDANGLILKDGAGNNRTHLVTRCAMLSDPINPSPELQRIRQSLFAEDWYIDLDRKCIVPKPDHVGEGSCYGINSNTRLTHTINYDTFDVLGCGFNNPEGLCPHYASVCYRQ
jgi:hypothetical protein